MIEGGIDCIISAGIVWGDAGETFFDGRPPRFDVIEIWRIGWKVEELASGGFDGQANGVVFMKPSVIHDDGLAWHQIGDQKRFNPE